jgi:hypothetical protein
VTQPPEDDTQPLTDARSEVHQAMNGGAPEQVAAAAATEGRRWFSRSVLAACLVSIVVSACFSLAAFIIAGRTGKLVDEQAVKVATVQKLAEDAKAQGDLANQMLSQRGQATVPIPKPNPDDNSEVLVASATAQVLASLPDTRPTAVQLGEAVALFVAAHPIEPVGPSPQQIAEGLAGYLAVNPPPAGPTGATGVPGRDCDPVAIPECRGPQGDKGDPPTAAEIRAALDRYIRAHPDMLCPNGGTFTALKVQLADKRGTADTWQCVVAVSTPPSTTDPTPPGLPLLPTK